MHPVSLTQINKPNINQYLRARNIMCTVQGRRQVKLNAYEPGSGPAKVWGADVASDDAVSIYFNATGGCWGQKFGHSWIFYLRPGDHADIMDAIDDGNCIELWGVHSGGIRINNASKKEVP